MRKLRLLLFPFAGIYYGVTLLRNALYDHNILESKEYSTPVICVGNLSVGGTGKSPMTEYIIRLFKENYRVATLSRGYGRSTKGFREVYRESTAMQVGDEPLQFAIKFPDITVVVCEDRQEGIAQLLEKRNKPEVIILDDAYQHRKVAAGFNILLTAYDAIYADDFLLPAGNLRESKLGAARAQAVVVTKCPEQLTIAEKDVVRRKLQLKSYQSLYFSKIAYQENVMSASGASQLNSLKVYKVTLVTGIANPTPFLSYIESKGLSFDHKEFKDHHNFTANEIEMLDRLPCILTTEKDYVRLQPLLKKAKVYYIPIKMEFLDGAEDFSFELHQFVKNNL